MVRLQQRISHRRPPPARSHSRKHSKSPHRRYTHLDGADSKVPTGPGTQSKKTSADARGRSASSRRARDTVTGSPGRRGGTRTLPDTTGTTACGRVPGHRDFVQASRALLPSNCCSDELEGDRVQSLLSSTFICHWSRLCFRPSLQDSASTTRFRVKFINPARKATPAPPTLPGLAC